MYSDEKPKPGLQLIGTTVLGVDDDAFYMLNSDDCRGATWHLRSISN